MVLISDLSFLHLFIYDSICILYDIVIDCVTFYIFYTFLVVHSAYYSLYSVFVSPLENIHLYLLCYMLCSVIVALNIHIHSYPLYTILPLVDYGK